MAKKQEEEVKITLICWKCDRRFSVLLSTIKKKRVTYLGEDDEDLGSRLIQPKRYLVPCPYDGAENEVTLP